MAGAQGKISFLVVATEWFSKHGGLPTFNRELCTALGQLGHDVYCLVPQASPEEIAAARGVNVQLVLAKDGPAASSLVRKPDRVRPDVVIGHDRFTGEAGKIQARDHFPGSLFALFVHVAPDEVEPFKERPAQGSSAKKGEVRTEELVRLATSADLVIGVGPHLKTWVRDKLRARRSPVLVHQFDPGLFDSPLPIETPERVKCLVTGRAEDDNLKGLDLAAAAINMLSPGMDIGLIVRGAPDGTGDDLQRDLVELMRGCRTTPIVREYTSEKGVLQADLLESSIFLMPSRGEGFGLVGLEAISAGIPTLVSSRSGLGELLADLGCSELVVTVTNDDQATTKNWAERISDVLRNRTRAFAKALAVRKQLQEQLSWAKSAEKLTQALDVLLRKQGKGRWRHSDLATAVTILQKLIKCGFTLEQIEEFTSFKDSDQRYAFVDWLVDWGPFDQLPVETRTALLQLVTFGTVDDDALLALLSHVAVSEAEAFFQASKVFAPDETKDLIMFLTGQDDMDPALQATLASIMVDDFDCDLSDVYDLLEGLPAADLERCLRRYRFDAWVQREYESKLLEGDHDPFPTYAGDLRVNDVYLNYLTNYRFGRGNRLEITCHFSVDFHLQWGPDDDISDMRSGSAEIKETVIVHSDGAMEFVLEEYESNYDESEWDGSSQYDDPD